MGRAGAQAKQGALWIGVSQHHELTSRQGWRAIEAGDAMSAEADEANEATKVDEADADKAKKAKANEANKWLMKSARF